MIDVSSLLSDVSDTEESGFGVEVPILPPPVLIANPIVKNTPRVVPPILLPKPTGLFIYYYCYLVC